MFWRMAGFSTSSSVDAILDKDSFTLEELLEEDEIISEFTALNVRLLNFLRDRVQVEQLIRYLIEEPLEVVENKRRFQFPFIACEIITSECEPDIILKTIAEDEELMLLLFSFLEPKETHNSLLAEYFSKVVICLLVQKTIPFMQFIKDHQEILKQFVDLIGSSSIMEVIKHLVSIDKQLYSNTSARQWVEDTDVLEIILDKFVSSDSPKVHANTAEILCTVARYGLPGLVIKLSSPSCIGSLLRHTLEDSRPKSVLVNALSVCIYMLGIYPETVEGMLGSLGDLLMLLNVSSAEGVLLTTYGKLQPPLGMYRLKIVEFVSALLSTGSEAVEKEVIRLGAMQRLLDLFFEYPCNNFLHHHVENAIKFCLESQHSQPVDHLFSECNLIGRILEAEKYSTLTAADSDKLQPTVSAEGGKPVRIGSIGHLTRISNKLLELANTNVEIQSHLLENSEWMDWQTDVLSKRNTLENVYSWGCGRPTSLNDRNRDNDDDAGADREDDVAAIEHNLFQAFRYCNNNNGFMDEAQGTKKHDDDDEDGYFDDEAAEAVISSLHLDDEQEESNSFFSYPNWFSIDDAKAANERSMSSIASTSTSNYDGDGDDEADDLDDFAASSSYVYIEREDLTSKNPSENPSEPEPEKPASWVEWRESSESSSRPDEATILANGEIEIDKEDDGNERSADANGGEIMENLRDSGPQSSELVSPQERRNKKQEAKDAAEPGAAKEAEKGA